MAEIRMTRDFFLWCMSVIWLFAFASLYVQIPGLYGDRGILPARLVVEGDAKTWKDLWTGQPTLLRVFYRIGLDTQTGMDFLCVAGVVVAVLSMVSRAMRNSLSYFAMWAFYLSLYQVGQTFLWFQWDILLLEVGFLTVLVAPLLFPWWPWFSSHPHDDVTFWLVRWLLFRLMFASGVVKLTSRCPTWWGLTALDWHYESQCIPTPLAWYFHQLPQWFQKLSVVLVYVIEIALPFLFFVPVRSLRLFACAAQCMLMVLIFMTGNYNFFNLVTMVLCISLLDDNVMRAWMRKKPKDDGMKYDIANKFRRPLKWLLCLATYGGLIYGMVKLFNLKVVWDPFHIESKVMFTYNDLTWFLEKIVPITIYMGAASLAWHILRALVQSLVVEKGIVRKFTCLVGCVLFSTAAIGMFAISLIPHTVLDYQTQNKLPPKVREYHELTKKLELTNSYGLFRSMTGVGGRPEVIIEASRYPDRGWKEYKFRYKPGNVSWSPPWVAPHQPRLDWQMWFAALGSYNHNPWFLNLIYRLFTSERDVMALMADKNPFRRKMPTYIKATLYHYHFTRLDTNHTWHSRKNWWIRKQVSEYLPMITVDEPSFQKYLEEQRLLRDPPMRPKPNFLKYCLQTIRSYIKQMEGFLFTMSLFVTALLMTFLDPSVHLRGGS